MKPFAIFLLLTGTAQATNVRHEREVAEMGTPRDLEAIGVVTSVAGQATGFLVGDCEVLTVKHAAGSVESTIGRRMDFRQAGRNGYHSQGTVIAEGNLDLLKDWFSGNRLGDWMVLRLDQCLGRSLRPARLSTEPVYRSGHWSPGSPGLQLAGFPKGRTWREGITRDPDCHVSSISKGQYYNNCTARLGSSGSPIFAVGGEGTARQMVVFAMHSAIPFRQNVSVTSPYGQNIAIPSTSLGPLIARFLTETPLGIGPNNPKLAIQR